MACAGNATFLCADQALPRLTLGFPERSSQPWAQMSGPFSADGELAAAFVCHVDDDLKLRPE
jgi:hypothetical protein